MAKRTQTILICDLCGTEGDGVATHEVKMDRKSRTLEACDKCWSKIAKAFQPAIEKGRRTQKKPPAIRQGA